MTAVLSPAEQQEVTRFGIHDPEAFDQIIEHADDTIPCEGCGGRADLRVTIRCCRDTGHACLPCHQKNWGAAIKFLASCDAVCCLVCDHIFPDHSTVDDIYEVGQL